MSFKTWLREAVGMALQMGMPQSAIEQSIREDVHDLSKWWRGGDNPNEIGFLWYTDWSK